MVTHWAQWYLCHCKAWLWFWSVNSKILYKWTAMSIRKILEKTFATIFYGNSWWWRMWSWSNEFCHSFQVPCCVKGPGALPGSQLTGGWDTGLRESVGWRAAGNYFRCAIHICSWFKHLSLGTDWYSLVTLVVRTGKSSRKCTTSTLQNIDESMIKWF